MALKTCILDIDKGYSDEDGDLVFQEGLDDGSDQGSCSSESSADEEADFVEYNNKAFNSNDMDSLSKGWTAFIVGIVAP